MTSSVTDAVKDELSTLFLATVEEGLERKGWSYVQLADCKAFLCAKTALGTAILIYDDDVRQEAYLLPVPMTTPENSVRVPPELALKALHLVRAKFTPEDDARRLPGRGPVGTGYTHVLRVGAATHRITYIEGAGVCHVRLCGDEAAGTMHGLNNAVNRTLGADEASSTVSHYKPNAIVGLSEDDNKIARAFQIVCSCTVWTRCSGNNAEHMHATNDGLTIVLSKITEGGITAHTAISYATGAGGPISFGVNHPMVVDAWEAAESSGGVGGISSFAEKLLDAVRNATMVKTFDKGCTNVEADLKDLGTLCLKYSREGEKEKCEGYLKHPTAMDAPPHPVPDYLCLAFYKGLHGAKLVVRDGDLVAE